MGELVTSEIAKVLSESFILRTCNDRFDLLSVAVLENVLFHWKSVSESVKTWGEDLHPQINKFQEHIRKSNNLTIDLIREANPTFHSRSTTAVQMHLVDFISLGIVQREIHGTLTCDVASFGCRIHNDRAVQAINNAVAGIIIVLRKLCGQSNVLLNLGDGAGHSETSQCS